MEELLASGQLPSIAECGQRRAGTYCSNGVISIVFLEQSFSDGAEAGISIWHTQTSALIFGRPRPDPQYDAILQRIELLFADQIISVETETPE